MSLSSAGEALEASGREPLAHHQRLGQLGEHIARVAHELNAPVSLIAGSLGNLDRQFDTLLRYVEATRPYLDRHPALAEAFRTARVDYAVDNARTLLAICDEGVQRVGYVVEQLRTYARRGNAEPVAAPLDLTAVLHGAARLVARAHPNAPAVEWDLPALPALDGDAQALGQAFANLLANACEAVAGQRAPRLAVRARLLAAPARVEIRVADNGPGIPAELRGDVFAPFVTSKAAGVGLGLAIAREAIERHGGTLSLAQPEQGTEFVVRLPY
ncbi:MAG: ATP-binding protein [Deltaproteobacteria bacterium]|nr:ATP-binding protein [Deltaproteobacteria bacterium]